MKLLKIVTIIFMTYSLAGCDYEKASQMFIPKEESAFAKEFLQKLIDKDFEFIRRHASEELLPQLSDKKMYEISSYFPKGKLLSTEIIGSHTNSVTPSAEGENLFGYDWMGNFSFEYEFEDGWALANVVMIKKEGTSHVVAFNVYKTTASQKEINAFTLSNKSLFQYFVLIATAVVPIFIIVSLIFCLKTPIKSKKWLWIVFIILGFCTVTMNWTSGQFQIKPLSFLLFGAGAVSGGPYAPWVLSVSVPIGAILFWIKRNGFLQNSSNSLENPAANQNTIIEMYVHCEICGKSFLQDDVTGDVCPSCSGILSNHER